MGVLTSVVPVGLRLYLANLPAGYQEIGSIVCGLILVKKLSLLHFVPEHTNAQATPMICDSSRSARNRTRRAAGS